MRTLVFGGGLVGSMLATYLTRRGLETEVFERRPEPRKFPDKDGRSINLALSDRGWRALEEIDMAEPVRQIAIPMRGRQMHATDGTLTFQPYGQSGQAIYSVSRGLLNTQLLERAEAEGVRFRFGSRCDGVDMENTVATVTDLTSERTTQHAADLIFGADGAFSAVRATMQRTNRFNYSQQFIEHSYKELTIPADAHGGWQIEPHALHIWPRGRHMLIALPNPDGTFTCTLFCPFAPDGHGTPDFSQLDSPEAVQVLFERDFPDALALMPDLTAEFFRNPTASMVLIHCYPWVRHRTVLIGDASHAIVPFYGQGMNSGFEDCRVLNDLIGQSDDWTTILERYQQSRKPNTDAIAELAMQNFIEMRDHVGDPRFLLRKKIEARLQARYPERWQPLYSMVTFSHTPYAEALHEGQWQRRIMDQVMKTPGIETRWEDEAFLADIVERATQTNLPRGVNPVASG